MNKILVFWVFFGLLNFPTHAQEDLLLNVESAYAEARYATSLEESLKMIEQGSSDSAAISILYSYAGLSSEKLEDVANAMVYYRKAIEYKVPRLDIYDKMTALAKEQGDNANYEFALFSQAKEFPDYREDVLIKLNTHYYYTKQYKKLVGTAEEFLGLYPEDLNTNYYLAVAMQKLNNNAKAKVLYKKVISLDENYYRANSGLGVLLYKEAFAIWDVETKKYKSLSKPTRVDYHNYMQRLESSKVVYREALSYLVKADELKPNDNLKGLIKNAHSRLGEEEKSN